MRRPRVWALPIQPATTEELRRLGVSEEMIATQVRSGRLLRLRRGVYLAASAWPDDAAGQHLVLARAEVAMNPAAVISHESAAVAWRLWSPGFRRWHEQRVCVTLPAGGGHGSQTRARVHRVAPLPRDQIQQDGVGYPVTSPARTAVDLAVGLPLPEALVVLDAAARRLCESYVDRPRRKDYANERLVQATREELSRVARHRGVAALKEAITLVTPARESAAESLSAGHFHVAGLPQPLFQARIVTSSGVFFPDCYWPENRLIGECDGADKYADGEAYVREKAREQVFRDLNYGVVRWLAREIMIEPWVVVERVGRELGL